MTFARVAASSAVIALAGCAGTPSDVPAAERQAALKAASVVHVVNGGSGPMGLTTIKDAVGGGALASATKAQDLPPAHELRQRHAYPDPSVLVQARLAQRLQAGASIRAQLNREHFEFLARGISPEQAAAGDLRQRLPNTMVLMVDVPAYQMIYKAMAWQTYHLAYLAGRASLVDTAAGKVLWSRTCRVDNKGLNLEFNIAEFQSNDGARVKQVLETAAQACADELAEQLNAG